MELSIIIATKDREFILQRTLASAEEAIRHLQSEIIVVNDSKTTTLGISSNGHVRLLANPGAGVASARNHGARNASGELLLFIDDDILISKESIDHILSIHKKSEKIGLNLNWEYPKETLEVLSLNNFGRFLAAHQMTSFKGWYSHPSWSDNALFESTSVASFHLSMWRSHFAGTPGYNENFPHAGFEDYDFPVQLKKAEFKFYIDSRITVYHNESDRLTLENWLGSQQRRATTRRIAVKLGYKELSLQYGLMRRMILSLLSFIEAPLRWIIRRLSGYQSGDWVSFKLIAFLQAARIYQGYNAK